MTALPNQAPMSVEAYLRLDQSSTDARYEYIDGYVTLLAGGTLDHATISANVYRQLYESIPYRLPERTARTKFVGSLNNKPLRGTPCRVYTSDARVRLSEHRYVYPDVTVTCDERDRGKQNTIYYPRLIVEVLSPGTRDYDRGGKFTYYRACPTIQEYMLINTDYQAVEVFHRERADLWTLQLFQADRTVELTGIGASFSVAAVYEDTTVPANDTEA